MNYLDVYKNRLKSQGNTVAEGMINSTKQNTSNIFGNSPFSKFVLINNQECEVIITQEKNSQDKTILLRPDMKIDIGSVVKINDLNYLVIDFLHEGINEIYPQGKLRLCNSQFPIENKVTKTQIGTNPMTGQPIFEEIIEPIYVPCVVKHNTGRPSNTHQFMVPEGGLEITLQYQLSGNTVLDFEFEMYGQNYKIVDVDYTKVINNKGIMTIIAEKVV